MGCWEILAVGLSSSSAADREFDRSGETGSYRVDKETLRRVRLSPAKGQDPPVDKLRRTRGLVRHSLGGVGGASLRKRFRQSGLSLVELTVTLCLLLGIALFGMQTMTSAWMLQRWSIAQSMTDAYAGIETAYAQRWVFSDPALLTRWPTYPASATTTVTIGQTPKGPVTAQVIRTRKPPFTDTTGAASFQDPVTQATGYLLESYVVYQDGGRNYCKVSKVYRDQ